jgi:predicted amidohydrolase
MANLSITTVQTNLYWEDKAANLKMLEEKIGELNHAEVVVLPEMFSTGFSMRPEVMAEPIDGNTVTWMKNLASKKNFILTGSLIIEEKGLYFNRLIWMQPNGQFGYYDKRHLFAYAGEHEHYTSGRKRLIVQVKGWRILLLTCYDLRFPVWSRQKITDNKPEYDAIVYVANWPDRRSHAWKALLVARAIENQCYVIGVNRTGVDGNGIYHSGHTSVIDPLGETIYQVNDLEETMTHSLSYQNLQSIREKLPFWKDGDSFSIF